LNVYSKINLLQRDALRDCQMELSRRPVQDKLA
jgi:hypothetical protein